VGGLKLLAPSSATAQFPYPTPMTPDAQRNTSAQVRSEVGWLQNTTSTAPSYGAQGYGNVWERFQGVRGAYETFKQTLNPKQLADGANDLAELDAGLVWGMSEQHRANNRWRIGLRVCMPGG